MLLVETPSDTYEIRFSHPTTKVVLPGPAKLTIESRQTVCDLYKIVPSKFPTAGNKYIYTLTATGKARCHAGDQFRKAKGRKLALQRALKDAKLGKAERKLFWHAYQLRDAPKVKIAATSVQVQHSLTVH